MKKFSVLFILTAAAVLSSANAYAIDMEFYTYGGFDALYTAFSIAALIFGNNDYLAMISGAALLGLLGAAAASAYSVLSGQRANTTTFLFMWIFASLIYTGFIVPKGNIVLYDPVKNRSATIGGIPDGLVIVAGFSNLAERAMVEIINTTNPPVGFSENAGGVGFDVLLGLSSSGVVLSDSKLHASLERFITDCVFFEMLRPGTTLSEDLIYKNTDFMSLFAEAQSPAIYTLWYTAAVPAGETKTCTEAYALINTAITAAGTYDSAMAARCAESGFDPTIPEELSRCQSALVAPINWYQGASYSATQVFRQTHLAQTFDTALQKADPDHMVMMAAARSSGNAALASGAASGTYIPIIKAVMTAMAVCMVPIMVLFIPTPLFKTAISFMVSLFLLVMLWGAVDAILHSFVMNYTKKIFYEISSYQLGWAAVMNFGTASLKSLAIISGVRWVGLVIALTMAQTLIKTSGAYAMTQLAGSMTGNVEGAVKQESSRVTPEGQARAVGELEHAPSVMANAHKFDYSQRADAHTMSRMAGTGAGVKARDHFGGVEPGADRIATSNAANQIQGVTRTEGLGGIPAAAHRGSQLGQQERGRMFQDDRIARAAGNLNQTELAEFERNGLVTDKMAPAVGAALGLSPAQSKALVGARADFGVNQDTGQLMVTGARKQTGDGSTEWAGGAKKVSSTLTAPQLLDKADQLEDMGHVVTAQGMRGMVSPDVVSSAGTHGTAKAGRGMLAHETAKLDETRSFDDKLATVGVKHGSDVAWFDTASDKQGRDVSNLSTTRAIDPKTGELVTTQSDSTTGAVISKTGESTKDGVKTTTVYDASNPEKVAYQQQQFVQDGAQHFRTLGGDGNVIADSTKYGRNLGGANQVRQMVTDQKTALYAPIYEAKTDQERDTAFKTVATAMAGAEKTLYQDAGRDSHHSRGDANATLKTPGKDWFGGVGFSGQVGFESTQQTIYETQVKDYEDKLRNTYKAGKELNAAGYNLNEKAYMAERMAGFADDRYKMADAKAGQMHGAGKPIELAKDAAKKVAEEILPKKAE